MQNTTNPRKLGFWMVLLLICVSIVGCGIVAAQGDSPDLAAQDNGRGIHHLPEPAYSERWNEGARVCQGEADLVITACQDVCKERHTKFMQEYPELISLIPGPHTVSPPFPDVVGLLICYGWCDKNVWLPEFQSCLRKNNCELAPM
jgi:hypothetical protein